MRVRTRVVIAAVAALALVGGAAVWWSLTRSPSASDAAGQYLRALQDGDAATLRAMMPPTLPAAQRSRVLDAFAGATARISDGSIDGAVAADGGVRASARLDGHPTVLFFTLTREGDRWVLGGDFLGTLTARATLGEDVTIGGVESASGTEVALLPAVYPVRAAPAGILRGTSRIAVTGAAPVTVTVQASLDPAATATAATQLAAYEDACTRPAQTVPEHCGLRVPWAADLRSLDGLTFRIGTRPTLALAADGRTFAATGGVVVATARGTTWAGNAATLDYRADDWALRGTVVFQNGTMQLAVG